MRILLYYTQPLICKKLCHFFAKKIFLTLLHIPLDFLLVMSYDIAI